MQRIHWLTTGLLATLACGASLAQEQARVLSAVPVIQQLSSPQQVCEDGLAPAAPRSSGAGAVIGALIGGVAGNALGHGSYGGRRGPHGYSPGYGSNRGATTAIGAIAGGLIGHSVENAQASSGYETVRRCSTQTAYQQQTVGYDVTYEYAGRRYTTRMDRDPGPWLPIQVQPSGSYSSYEAPATSAPVYSSQDSSQNSYYYGPSGEYRPAPGVTVTETINYQPGYMPPPPPAYR